MKIRNGPSQAGFRFQSAVLSDGHLSYGVPITSGGPRIPSVQTPPPFLNSYFCHVRVALYFCSSFYSVLLLCGLVLFIFFITFRFTSCWAVGIFFVCRWCMAWRGTAMLIVLYLFARYFLRLSLMDGKSRQR